MGGATATARLAGLHAVMAEGVGIPEDGNQYTVGPMLTFEVNGKPGMGAEIPLDAPSKLKVAARAESQYPLDRVELVRNGYVELELPVSDDRLSAEFEGGRHTGRVAKIHTIEGQPTAGSASGNRSTRSRGGSPGRPATSSMSSTPGGRGPNSQRMAWFRPQSMRVSTT